MQLAFTDDFSKQRCNASEILEREQRDSNIGREEGNALKRSREGLGKRRRK
jgi:hypothetical protein